jgi:membrane dipeptidase
MMIIFPAQQGMTQISEQRVQNIHQQALVFDAHAHDVFRVEIPGIGLTESSDQIDFTKMKNGGMDAVFFSLPLRAAELSLSPEDILEDISYAKQALSRCSDQAIFATTTDEILTAEKQGKRAILFSLEYFYGLFGGKASTLADYFRAGIRCITLIDNQIDPLTVMNPNDQTERDLSDLGKKVVAQMNRLGMIIDITHLPDQTQVQIIEASTAPVIVSHSNIRSVVNENRNLSDAVLTKLAAKGGAVFLTFHPRLVTGDTDTRQPKYQTKDLKENRPRNPIDDLIDHFDCISNTVGVDHVGIGTDYAGSGQHASEELYDATRFPDITAHLVRRGYDQAAIDKILGGNMLRILNEVRHFARNKD